MGVKKIRKEESFYIPAKTFEEFIGINESVLFGAFTGQIWGANVQYDERDYENFQENEYERTQGRLANE